MKITLIVIGSLYIIPLLLKAVFPTKCPKCFKKCNEDLHFGDAADSFYYSCPEHGNIEKL
jgi:hypothetical protein